MPRKDRESRLEYMRSYKRKMRTIPSERSKLIAINRKWKKEHPEYGKDLKKQWDHGVKNLSDWYVLKLLVQRTGLTRQELAKNKTLINNTKRSILTKRIKRAIALLK